MCVIQLERDGQRVLGLHSCLTMNLHGDKRADHLPLSVVGGEPSSYIPTVSQTYQHRSLAYSCSSFSNFEASNIVNDATQQFKNVVCLFESRPVLIA